MRLGTSEARRRVGGRLGGTWHIHLDRGTNLNSALNPGDRFFESLFGPSSNLGHRQGGDGDGKSRSLR